MILPKAIVPDDIYKECDYYYPDSPTSHYVKHDLEAYHNYPNFTYKFNNRGLRDEDWPDDLEELKKGYFAVGDSGTMAVGLPYEYGYTRVVEKELGVRVYKIGRVEACNVRWIFANVKDILEHIKPKVIFIQWSFAWRNNLKKSKFSWNSSKQDDELLVNLIKQVERLKGDTRILHCLVRENLTRQFFKMIKDLPIHTECPDETDTVDMARDNLHYGIETNKHFAHRCVRYVRSENTNIW